MERMEQKIDKVLESISEIKVAIAKQQGSLEDYVRRTELLEEANDNIREDMKPLQKHVWAVGVLAKVFVVTGAIVGVAAGFVNIVRFVNGHS